MKQEEHKLDVNRKKLVKWERLRDERRRAFEENKQLEERARLLRSWLLLLQLYHVSTKHARHYLRNRQLFHRRCKQRLLSKKLIRSTQAFFLRKAPSTTARSANTLRHQVSFHSFAIQEPYLLRASSVLKHFLASITFRLHFADLLRTHYEAELTTAGLN